MRSFHILHYIPNHYLHILNGYQDVIDSLVWALRALGHAATNAVNERREGATHILFGFQFMPADLLASFAPDTIVYNLEQLDGVLELGLHTDGYRFCAEHFGIWDYSQRNLELWRAHFAARCTHLVPVGFAPTLCRIPPSEAQDIDVLFYGQPSEYRSDTLKRLSRFGLKILSFYGLYGPARDEFIGRSKMVLNLRASPDIAVFSSVRVGYLLANRKAVVSDVAACDADLAEAVCVGEPDQIPLLCKHLADNDPQRLWYEAHGYEAFARRDLATLLRPALDALSAP